MASNHHVGAGYFMGWGYGGAADGSRLLEQASPKGSVVRWLGSFGRIWPRIDRRLRKASYPCPRPNPASLTTQTASTMLQQPAPPAPGELVKDD
jgi:hypothetical protein